MSTHNGHMQGKSRKVLHLLIEADDHKALTQLAAHDHRSLATIIRDMLRQGLETRHGIGTRKVVDEARAETKQLSQEMKDFRALMLAKFDTIQAQQTQLDGLLRDLMTAVSRAEPSTKKSWF